MVSPHHQGQPERDAEILKVLEGARPRFRVRWQDDRRENIVYPGEDVFVERPTGARSVFRGRLVGIEIGINGEAGDVRPLFHGRRGI